MYSLNLVKSILLALSASTFASAAKNAKAATGASAAALNSEYSEDSAMKLTVFAGSNCDTAPYVTEAPWGKAIATSNGTAAFQVNSYKLSRPTCDDEQLDFSGPNKGEGVLYGKSPQCTLFHETTSPDSNGNTLAGDKCYGLQLGPAECFNLFVRA